MRLATWNVNSIRARVDRVVAWLERSDVDVLAIQETKSRDEQFPYDAFKEAGYEVAHLGYSQWNGVAVASRVGLADVEARLPGHARPGASRRSTEARALGATCGGVRVWSLYVPNGREPRRPAPASTSCDWLEALRVAGAGWLAADPDAQVALCGDWNIAPPDEDVWDMRVFATSDARVARRSGRRSQAVVEAGFADLVRPLAPGPGVYTYWDYTQLRFAAARGHADRLRPRLAGAAAAGDRRR